MLANFLTNKNDVKLAQWLLNHPFDFYAASTVGLDIGLSPRELAESIHTLKLYDILIEEHDLNSDATYFNIRLNTDSDISKALFELNHALESFAINPSDSFGFDMADIEKSVDGYDQEDLDRISNQIKNWRDELPEPNNMAEMMLHSAITDELEMLERNGELEDFVNFVKNLKDIV